MGISEGLWAVDDDEYFADRECVSNSMLLAFSKSVPAFHAEYVTGETASPGGSEAMEFGKAFHLALLEPDRVEECIAVAPECDRRTKEGKAVWEAFLAGSAGRVVVTKKDADLIEKMVRAVMANPVAVALLQEPGYNEQAIRWQCPVTGVWCRGKIDRLLTTGVVVDIKTTADASPHEFSRSAGNYGYDRQAAFYTAGVDRLREIGVVPERTGRPEDNDDGVPFFFIAVSKAAVPECVVYRPTDDMLAGGRASNAAALHRLRDCRDFDTWEAETHGRIVPLSVPAWARR